AAADAAAGRHHHHDRHVVVAGPGPALVAGDLHDVDDVEGVVAELDLAHGPAAGVGDAHGGAEDAALVERGVPGGAQALGGGEDAAERRADVLAEDVGDAEVFLAVVEGQADGLDECGHAGCLGRQSWSGSTPSSRSLAAYLSFNSRSRSARSA